MNVDNAKIDPPACEAVPGCTLGSLGSSQLIAEPVISVDAALGNLTLTVTQPTLLQRMQPARIGFVLPGSATSCALLPTLLGTGLWTQGVTSCEQVSRLSTKFDEVVKGFASCWSVQSSVVPTTGIGAAQVVVSTKTFSSVVQVIQSVAGAPLENGPRLRSSDATVSPGPASRQRQSGTLVTQTFQRLVSVVVPVSIVASSVELQTTGNIRYRLRALLYDGVTQIVTAEVETRVPFQITLGPVFVASVLPATPSPPISAGAVSGGSTCVGNTDPGYEAGYCTQVFSIPLSPACSVSGLGLQLTAKVNCEGTATSSLCGSNVNLGAATTAPYPMPLSYEFCPSTQIFAETGSVQIFSAAARVTPLVSDAVIFFGQTQYGRFSVSALVGATIQSVTVTSLAVFQPGNPAPLAVGAAFSPALPAPVLAVPTAAIFDFEWTVSAPLVVGTLYYVQATATVVLQETGSLRRTVSLTIQTRSDSSASPSTSAKSVTVRVAAAPIDSAVAVNGSTSAGVIVGATVAGIVVAALVVALVIFAVRRTKKRQLVQQVSTELETAKDVAVVDFEA